MKSWQKAMPLAHLADSLGSPIDTFICSASFEERCKSVTEAIAGKIRIKRSLVCFNERSVAAVSENANQLQKRLGINATQVPLDKANPIGSADLLQKTLLDLPNEGRPLIYLVDITTFTHEALLILLKILQPRLVRRNRAILVYAPASEYAVGLREEQKWLSKGILDVRSVLGYPGEMRASRGSHLIILVGFEHDRAERLIEVYQPNVVSLGFGTEGTATAPIHERVNRKSLEMVARKLPNCSQFDFSCVDIALAEAAIASQAAKFPEYNVVVAPMNTKLSTVGVAGAAFRNEGMQLCYARAALYNVRGYSRPGKSCIIANPPPVFWSDRNRLKKHPNAVDKSAPI